MKSMNDHRNDGNCNWLGFSLSTHMKMEAPSDPHNQYHQVQAAASSSSSNIVPTSFYIPPPQINSSAMCYAVGDNGGFSSPLSVMPLKSDGSLCIIEALNRSQTEGLLSFTLLLFSFNICSALHRYYA